jgi:glutathione-dependent peroxiredoxin
MTQLKNQEGKSVNSEVKFPVRENNQWKHLSTNDIFTGKKVVVFSLPGAFTPTCSSTHLPRYEELYHTFKANGIDEVYCISVNDTFVMNEWAKAQQIEKVKMLPDGNTAFTNSMEMLVDKENLGFGKRSWRYSMLIDDGKVVKHFIEPDVEGDPFEVSDADTMLNFINPDCQKPQSITIFSKEGCPFCQEAKDILTSQGKQYSEVVLSDAVRQKTLSALTGNTRPTSPQIFIDGTLVGGLEEFKKAYA